MASNGQTLDSNFSCFPPPQQPQPSHHGHSLQGPPHAHSDQLQQHVAPTCALPPQAYRQQPFPPSQQLPTTKRMLPHSENEAPRPAPVHVLPVPAVQTHHMLETNMNICGVPTQVQHDSRRSVVVDNNLYPNHVMINSSTSHSGHQTISERQPVQGSGTRPSDETAGYIPEQNTNSRVNGSHVMTNAIPPQQAYRKFMQNQNTAQNPIHFQGHRTMDPHLPFHEPLPQVARTAQFPTNATSDTTNIQPSPSQQRNIYLSKDVEQAADRHAASILARAFPALKFFQEAQHNVIRNVLLDLNSKYISHVGALQGALRRSHQVEQEARQKQEAALQASESIVAQAMKWKESLENTRRNFTILQERHEKLAQLALQQNKLLSTDTSASSVAALIDRISYLEGRLKQYENVIPTRTEASSPVSAKERVDLESTLPSPTVQRGRSPREKGLMMDGTDANKGRLKNEMNIVSKLVERKPRPEFPNPVVTETVKEEPLTTDEEKKSLNTPYIIDLTIDTLDQIGFLASSTAQVVNTEITPLLTDSSLVMENPSTSPVAGDETFPSTDPSSSFRAALPAESASFREADALKRSQENESDDNRARKRPRPENSTMTQAPLDTIDHRSLSPETREGVEDIEAVSSPVLVNNGLKETKPGRVAIETNETIPPIDKSGKDTDKVNQALQLDPLYLQLIYHKYDSGITECRFCLMEIDHGTRRPDKETVFPVTVSNDELIAHASTSHQADVLHLSRLERTDVLAAFSKIMEAA